MNIIQKDDTSSGLRCLICNGHQLNKIAVNTSFGIDIVECSSCHFVQSEYVSAKTLKDYYEKDYLNQNEQQIVEYRVQQNKQAESQINYIREICGEPTFANVLDYGASLGEMARKLKSISNQVYVVEYNSKYIEILKKKNIFTILYDSDLFTSQFEDYFGLISLSHVLEHIPDPLALLDNFSYVLKNDGYLMVDLPNGLQVLKGYNAQARGHLHYFTIDSFQNMIKSQDKFEIIEIRTCNRTVEEYIASGFRLPEDYSRLKTENGTVIRAMLRNIGKEGISERSIKEYINEKDLLHDFSHRIYLFHKELMLFKQAILREQDK